MKATLRSAISWRNLSARWGIFFGLCLAAAVLPAQDLVRVEEDWELVIGEPDSNSAGPQVACTLSPFNNIDTTYFTLEFNHRSVPYWSPGGITLHQWSGEWLTQSMERPDRSIMQANDETVTWKQVLDVHGGVLTFQVKDGTSSTWGPFGFSSFLKLQTNWGANHINGYTPDVSVARSGVSYAGNRVKSLKILRVHATLADGNTATDNTVRVVHQLPSP